MGQEWFKWSGGECPVGDRVEVEVELRCGERGFTDKPNSLSWSKLDSEDFSGRRDIVAYRIVRN